MLQFLRMGSVALYRPRSPFGLSDAPGRFYRLVALYTSHGQICAETCRLRPANHHLMAVTWTSKTGQNQSSVNAENPRRWLPYFIDSSNAVSEREWRERGRKTQNRWCCTLSGPWCPNTRPQTFEPRSKIDQQGTNQDHGDADHPGDDRDAAAGPKRKH
jgi:hypothetical protein